MHIYWSDIQLLVTNRELLFSVFPELQTQQHRYTCLEDGVLHYAGTALVRYGMSGYSGSDRPYYYNISHSGTLAVCVVGNSPSGIDIEQLRPYPEDISSFFHPAEQQYLSKFSGMDRYREFYRLWTRKESLYKAQRLNRPNLLDLACMVTPSGHLRSRFSGWTLEELPIRPQEYVAVVCSKASEAPSIRELHPTELASMISEQSCMGGNG